MTALALVLLPAMARAQAPGAQGQEPRDGGQAPAAAAAWAVDADDPVAAETPDQDTPENAAETAAQSPAGERELGARVGLVMGGRTTPGGVRMSGVMLYRMSDTDWFDGSLGFTVGSGSSGCAPAPAGPGQPEQSLACSHGPLRGASVDVVLGVRRFFAQRQHFAPYLRAGVGLRVVRFDGDEVDGVAIPLVLGSGVRARLSELIAVGGDVALEAGLGMFDRDLGVEPQLGLSLQAVIEFWL